MKIPMKAKITPIIINTLRIPGMASQITTVDPKAMRMMAIEKMTFRAHLSMRYSPRFPKKLISKTNPTNSAMQTRINFNNGPNIDKTNSAMP